LIEGGYPLNGSVKIQGSKNASLPILAATLLVKGKTVIRNCPEISDIRHMVKLLESAGCVVYREHNSLTVDAGNVGQISFPGEHVDSMRSSIVLLGAMLGRIGEVVLQYPGGCVIGKRPIDIHIWALKQLGVRFLEEEAFLHAKCCGAEHKKIRLPIVSVGVTENLILLSVLGSEKVVIQGAAKEPEIVELCKFLNGAGAKISGFGTDEIQIEGVVALKETEFAVVTDRIVAGTYLLAAAGCGGDVFLEDVPMEQLESVFQVGENLGASLEKDVRGRTVRVRSKGCVRSIPLVETEVYPGFPTDLQSGLLAVLAKADGISMICENIFENRFRIVSQLNRMGARIYQKDNKVAVFGVKQLYGCELKAKELRGGAALVTAALMAEGKSVLFGKKYIERGYEDLCRDFRQLGARISLELQ